jgi:hypothetical protein
MHGDNDAFRHRLDLGLHVNTGAVLALPIVLLTVSSKKTRFSDTFNTAVWLFMTVRRGLDKVRTVPKRLIRSMAKSKSPLFINEGRTGQWVDRIKREFRTRQRCCRRKHPSPPEIADQSIPVAYSSFSSTSNTLASTRTCAIVVRRSLVR